MLTSLDERDLKRTGVNGGAHDQVMRLAELAEKAGLDGIVCSGQEVAAVHKQWKDGLLRGPRPAPAGRQQGATRSASSPRARRATTGRAYWWSAARSAARTDPRRRRAGDRSDALN